MIRNQNDQQNEKGLIDLKLDDKRLKVYQELFFNNFKSSVKQCFPVLNEIISEDKWNHLIKLFMKDYGCESPYFCDIPSNFIDFLTSLDDKDLPFPFFLEMAHYEWIELDLSLDESAIENYKKINEVTEKTEIILTPYLRLLAYQYPVHQISKTYLPEKPGQFPSCFIVFRKDNFEIEFVKVTPVIIYFLNIFSDDNMTVKKAYKILLDKYQAKVELSEILAILNQFHHQGIILGEKA